MSFFRDTAVSAISTIALTGSRFVVTLILARWLTPTAYGDLIFTQWMMDLAFMVCSAGLPGVMTRFLPALRYDPSGEARSGRSWLRGLSLASYATALAFFCIFLTVEGHRSLPETLVLVFWCGAYLMMAYGSPAMQGLFRYEAVMAGNFTFALAAPVLLFALLRHPTLVRASLALGLSWLLSALIACVTMAVVKPKLDRPALSAQLSRRQLTTYALNVWFTGLISGLVWSRGELGILKLRFDSAHIAFYSAALSLAGLVMTGAALLTGAVTPHLVRHWHAGETDRISAILRAVTQAVFILTSVAAVFLIGVGDVLVPLLLGKAYSHSYAILAVLGISSVSVASGCANAILQIESDAKFGVLVNLLGLAGLIAISFLLTPVLGIMGAAVARTVTQGTVALVTFSMLQRIPGLSRMSLDFCVALALVLAALAGFYFIMPTLCLGLYGRFFVSAGLSFLLVVSIRKIVGVPLGTFVRMGRAAA
jgi:O-antigen/teichoic acid export membrane protein